MRLTSLVFAGFIFATPLVAHADEDGSALVTPDHAHRAIRSPALLGGGIALTVVGAAAIPLGFVITYLGHGSCGLCEPPDLTAQHWAGAMIIGSGVASIAGGVVMIVVGGKRVPVTISSGPRGSAGLTFEARF